MSVSSAFAQTNPSENLPTIDGGCITDGVEGSCRKIIQQKKENADIFCRHEFNRRGLEAPTKNPCFGVKELLCMDELLSTGLYSPNEVTLEEACSQLAVFKWEQSKKILESTLNGASVIRK